MSVPALIRPEAEEDLRLAFSWYEHKRAGLGDDFLLCVEVALSQIERNPLMYPEIYKQTRRALVRRFPYAVFYVFSNQIVSIIAVFHCRRYPETWRRRLKDVKSED